MRGDVEDGTLWAFEGNAGQQVVIDVTSDDFDTFLTLIAISEQGDADFDDDNGGEDLNSRLELELPFDGWYLVVVTDVRSGDSGGYQIRVEF